MFGVEICSYAVNANYHDSSITFLEEPSLELNMPFVVHEGGETGLTLCPRFL